MMSSTIACLVQLGRFLDEELWTDADVMIVQIGGSKVNQRVGWVREWSENVSIARVEAACSVGE